MSSTIISSKLRETRMWWYADTDAVEVRQVEGMKVSDLQYYVQTERATLVVGSHLFEKRSEAIDEVNRIIRKRHALIAEQLQKADALMNSK
jgi:hypothetical protein